MDSSSEELAHTFPPFFGKSVAGNLAQTQLNGMHQKDESGAGSTPPALPPKTRKSKGPEAPKELEISDRGDSDMDEDTHSSNQDKHKSMKVVSEIIVIWFVIELSVNDLLFAVERFLLYVCIFYFIFSINAQPEMMWRMSLRKLNGHVNLI